MILSCISDKCKVPECSRPWIWMCLITPSTTVVIMTGKWKEGESHVQLMHKPVISDVTIFWRSRNYLGKKIRNLKHNTCSVAEMCQSENEHDQFPAVSEALMYSSKEMLLLCWNFYLSERTCDRWCDAVCVANAVTNDTPSLRAQLSYKVPVREINKP